MSRYPNVRPKPDQHKQTRNEAAERTLKLETTVRQAADELYIEHDGASIDAAIARYENLLKLHDQEMVKLQGHEDEPYRWKVAPTVVIRLQRELERLQKRREELLGECIRISRQLIQDFMQAAPAPAQETRQQQPATQDTVQQPSGKAAPAERSQADATTRAA